MTAKSQKKRKKMKRTVSILLTLGLLAWGIPPLGEAYAMGSYPPASEADSKAVDAKYPSYYDVQTRGEIFRPPHKADQLKLELNSKKSDMEEKLVESERYKLQPQSSEIEENINSTLDNIVGILGRLLNDPTNGYLLGLLDYYFNELIKWLDKLFREIFEGNIEINAS